MTKFLFFPKTKISGVHTPEKKGFSIHSAISPQLQRGCGVCNDFISMKCFLHLFIFSLINFSRSAECAPSLRGAHSADLEKFHLFFFPSTLWTEENSF